MTERSDEITQMINEYVHALDYAESRFPVNPEAEDISAWQHVSDERATFVLEVVAQELARRQDDRATDRTAKEAEIREEKEALARLIKAKKQELARLTTEGTEQIDAKKAELALISEDIATIKRLGKVTGVKLELTPPPVDTEVEIDPFRNLPPAQLSLFGLAGSPDAQKPEKQAMRDALDTLLTELVPDLITTRQRLGKVRNAILDGTKLPGDYFTYVRGRVLYFHGTPDREIDSSILFIGSNLGPQTRADLIRIVTAIGQTETRQAGPTSTEDLRDIPASDVNFTDYSLRMLSSSTTLGNLVRELQVHRLGANIDSAGRIELKRRLHAIGLSSSDSSPAPVEVAEAGPIPLSTTVEDLGFTVRVYNCLHREGITNLEEILQYSGEELAAISHKGGRIHLREKDIQQIKAKLAEHEISLRDAQTDEGPFQN